MATPNAVKAPCIFCQSTQNKFFKIALAGAAPGLLLQLDNALALRGRHARPQAAVDLSLLDPMPQCLGADPEL